MELVFPWELSRFYFGINLAQKYLINKDTHYYKLFKKLVKDWIEKILFYMVSIGSQQWMWL